MKQGTLGVGKQRGGLCQQHGIARPQTSDAVAVWRKHRCIGLIAYAAQQVFGDFDVDGARPPTGGNSIGLAQQLWQTAPVA